MKGFNFEKNLVHQTAAVESVVSVFEEIGIKQPTGTEQQFVNPKLNLYDENYFRNIKSIQSKNEIGNQNPWRTPLIDIMMETGTGKTYTYTKTMFELNKNFGIFKFVVIVPTLPIKAGTIDFLKSDSARSHFKEQYGKTITLHIVESKKGRKSKKSYLPPAVNSFVTAGNFDKNRIQVLIINAGMINSETMRKQFDKSLFDKYNVPFDAIAAVKPFMIIDEPHKFGTKNKTWTNIEKMGAQFTLRYGATFPEKEILKKDVFGKKVKIKVKDYHNLVYTLTAVDSFNNNLVKGVIGHVTEFENGKNSLVKLTSTDGKEANFELNEDGKKRTFKLSKKESLEKVHSAMQDLFIEKLNKSVVVLSNGLELKKGDKINPFSFSVTIQELMIKKAIHEHFILEKKLLKRQVKIKPLTLFFIDNIEEYRSENGTIKTLVEAAIKAETEVLLKTETDGFYRQYLEQTLVDISKTHGGYFSKDNSEKDEAIEKEINDILHDKQSMLDLKNPRRFIFSKWTLREGWDNPNVFQICKLRSSGSDISKLQEVGRGLRLPVNEYNNRVKGEQFYLNYFVDFTENEFVENLVKEINDKSGAFSIEANPEKLSDGLIKKICTKYNRKEDELIDELGEKGIISFSRKFKEDGYDFIKENYPLAFEGIDSKKVRKATDEKKKVNIRTEKYAALKELWEKLNEKVILEYKISNEAEFKTLFINFLNDKQTYFTIDGIKQRQSRIEITENIATATEEISILNNEIIKVSTMRYDEFLMNLAKVLAINIKTLHECFVTSSIKINDFLNASTIRIIKQKFNDYLMYNAFSKFEIAYQSVSSSIHPTKLTNRKGQVKKEINASDVGVFSSTETVAKNYFFEELFYDSNLEMDNIKTNIEEVIVFTKIPKNSIKIPIAGGKSYSPDFAYVLNFDDGDQKLYFVVETKNTTAEALRDEERQKIKHAEIFFDNKVKITFKKQFSHQKIAQLIGDIRKS